jgi:hypothetical protein
MAVYTEMTYASWLAGKLEGLSEQGGFRWTKARVETKVAGDAKRADIILSTPTRDELVIEVKRPENHEDNPFANAVISQASDYAKARGIDYFVTHNIQSVATWQVGHDLPLDQAFVAPVDALQEFEGYSDEILDAWRKLLPRLETLVSTGKPLLPLETTFAEMVGQNIDSIVGSTTMVALTTEKVIADPSFRREFDHWLATRGRNPPQTDKEAQAEAAIFVKQVLYAWCNQLLFYRAIQQRYGLGPLLIETPKTLPEFAQTINARFVEAMKATGDFETVFVPPAPFLPVCDAPGTAKVVALARNLDFYDFSRIPYDILGGLFQRLLIQRERHLMGQFFTPTPLADLIIALAGRGGGSYLDPACGSGTFLIRSYNRVRTEEGLDHKRTLPRVWGFDIAQYPAHLATVNLALQDLKETDNHPNVSRTDFFKVDGPTDKLAMEYAKATLIGYGANGKSTKARVAGLGVEEHTVVVPTFETVVGNPPYTRFQELRQPEFGPKYLETIRQKLMDAGLGPLPKIEAGIYAYFILHAKSFLQEGGHLGFVLLRQWLDVEYGAELKKFILGNFKIVVAVESEDERWFEDAQMLPMFLILERCDSKSKRGGNVVRFVRLGIPLSEIGGFGEDMDRMEQARYWTRLGQAARWLSGLSPAPNPKLESQVHIQEVRQADLDPAGKWSHFFRPTPVYDKVVASGRAVPWEAMGATLSYGTISGSVPYFVLTDTKNDWEVKKVGRNYVLSGPNGPAFILPEEFVHPYVNKFKDLNQYELDLPPDLIFSTSVGHGDLVKYEPDELKGQPLILDSKKTVDIRKKVKTLHDFLGLDGQSTTAVPHRGPLGYIEWGEMPIHSVRGQSTPGAISTSSAPSARKLWYDVPLDDPPQFILPTLVLQRCSVIRNRAKCHNSQNVYGLTFEFAKVPPAVRSRLATLARQRGIDAEELYLRAAGALLNSSYVALALDRAGRYVENRDASIGVKLELQEWRRLLLPDLSALDAVKLAQLADLYDDIRVAGPMQMTPRLADKAHQKLDRFVATTILGLTLDEAKSLTEELRQLFEARQPPGT